LAKYIEKFPYASSKKLGKLYRYQLGSEGELVAGSFKSRGSAITNASVTQKSGKNRKENE
jgi:hypothetical protein